MKVLIVGADHELALERYFTDHFQYLGVQTHLINVREQLLKIIETSRIYRLIFFLIPGIFSKKISNELLKHISKESYTHVWIFKGIEILPKTIKKIKKNGQVVINYNPDHPFIRSSYFSQNSNVRKAVRHYDLYFSYSLDLCQKIKFEYDIDAVWLPFAVQDVYHSAVMKSKLSYECSKICFIGNPDKNRAFIINYLIQNNILIIVFGSNWSHFLSPDKNLEIKETVSGIKYWETLRKYPLQLNIFRKHNVNSHNMRSFEIPSVGSIQIAPSSAENYKLFTKNKSIFFYDSNAELLQVCRDLLLLETETLEKLKTYTFKEFNSLDIGTTYLDRAKLALRHLSET